MRRATAGFVACVLLATLASARAGAGAGAPNDPKFGEQWGLTKIGAPEAWDRGTGAGTVIAVVDTGVDLQHPDLKDKIVAHVSCVDADDDPSRCQGSGQDDDGHGTHVAGIAAAATGNGRGVAGTAPGAGIMAVKALGSNGTGAASDIRAGIRWAVDHGADVVNLSLGEIVVVARGIFGSSLVDAIDYAHDRGVVVAAAAGNDTALFGSDYGDVPAMIVTATTVDDGQPFYASGTGDAKWGIAAPGGDGPEEDQILSTWLDDPETDDKEEYAYNSGTSMATPFVSGAAAVLRGLGLSHQQAIDRLLATAKDLGPSGPDESFGYGRLDLAGATAGLGGSNEEPPPGPTTTVAGGPPVEVRVEGQTRTVSTAPPSGRVASQVAPPADPGTPTSTTPPAETERVALEAPDEPVGSGSGGSTGAGPLLLAGALTLVAALGAAGLRALRRRHVSRTAP